MAYDEGRLRDSWGRKTGDPELETGCNTSEMYAASTALRDTYIYIDRLKFLLTNITLYIFIKNYNSVHFY